LPAPASRRALNALLRGESPYGHGAAKSAVARAIEDLESVGLGERDSAGSASLTGLAEGYVQAANLPPKREAKVPPIS